MIANACTVIMSNFALILGNDGRGLSFWLKLRQLCHKWWLSCMGTWLHPTNSGLWIWPVMLHLTEMPWPGWELGEKLRLEWWGLRIESKGSCRGDKREWAERRVPSFYRGEVPKKCKIALRDETLKSRVTAWMKRDCRKVEVGMVGEGSRVEARTIKGYK